MVELVDRVQGQTLRGALELHPDRHDTPRWERLERAATDPAGVASVSRPQRVERESDTGRTR